MAGRAAGRGRGSGGGVRLACGGARKVRGAGAGMRGVAHGCGQMADGAGGRAGGDEPASHRKLAIQVSDAASRASPWKPKAVPNGWYVVSAPA